MKYHDESTKVSIVSASRRPSPPQRGHGTRSHSSFEASGGLPFGLVLTHDTLMTVRKTPPHDRPPYDPSAAREAVRPDDEAGMIAYRLVDDIAEHYLDLIDDLNAEIDELEDKVETLPAEQTRERLSELRHDLLHIRRTLSPMRDAVRRVVDNIVEVETGREVFRHEV